MFGKYRRSFSAADAATHCWIHPAASKLKSWIRHWSWHRPDELDIRTWPFWRCTEWAKKV